VEGEAEGDKREIRGEGKGAEGVEKGWRIPRHMITFYQCRIQSPPKLSLKPTVIDMTAPSREKVIPIDEITPQEVVTLPPPQYKSKREEGPVTTGSKNSTLKSKDAHKRRKRARRKSHITQESPNKEEDKEFLLTPHSQSSDEEEPVVTLLPLQRSHDQSCDLMAPNDTHSPSTGITGEGAGQTNSFSRELVLNSESHSVEEGGVASSQASHTQDTGRLVVH
jgi:hypothetical protein